MAEHNEIGKIGETMAKTFLMKLGFSIISQNYRVKQGEIDIIAKKDSILHFIEVKTIKVSDVSHAETLPIQPEDNLTYQKWEKLIYTINHYLMQKTVPHETDYQVDLACVYLNPDKREGRVKLIQNIHKEAGF